MRACARVKVTGDGWVDAFIFLGCERGRRSNRLGVPLPRQLILVFLFHGTINAMCARLFVVNVTDETFISITTSMGDLGENTTGMEV